MGRTLTRSRIGRILAGAVLVAAGVVASSETGAIGPSTGSDGTPDVTFSSDGIANLPNTVGVFWSVGVQSDGKIIAGGYRDSAGLKVVLARFNIDGTLDSTFGTNGIYQSTVAGEAYDIAIDGSDDIYVALFDLGQNKLMKVNAGGTLDTSFGTSGVATANTSSPDLIRSSAVTLVDGGLIVGAYGNAWKQFFLSKFDTSGNVDSSYGNQSPTNGSTIHGPQGGSVTFAGFAEQPGPDPNNPSDRTLAVGWAGANDNGEIVAFTSSGVLDTTFGSSGVVQTDASATWDVVVDGDRKIITVGGDGTDAYIERFTPDGTADSGFGSSGVTTVPGTAFRSVALTSDGKILAAGLYDNSGTEDILIVRLNSDGSLDNGFGTNGVVRASSGASSSVYDVMITSLGRVVAVGTQGDWATRTPTIWQFGVAVSTDSTLNGLSLDGATLNETFASATTSYTSSVGASIDSITVTPTVNDAAATVTVNGSPVTSGSASGAVSLNYGSNTITIEVTAEDSSTTSYTVTVERAVGVPGVPTAVTATAGNAQATVSWTAPSDNGGSAITGYTAQVVGDSSLSCTTTGATTCDITGLTNGTSYQFEVIATNDVGDSAASSPSTAVTPVGVPAAPTAVTATAGNAQATVSWTAPSDNGGSAITGYTAQVVDNSSLSCTTTSATTCDITGLTNGTAYQFEVIATNAQGNSAASTESSAVTPVAPSTGGGDSTSDDSTDSTDESPSTTDDSTDSTADESTDNTTDDSTDSDANSSSDVTTPAEPTTSDSIDDDEAAELTSEPGSAAATVDGEAVTPTVSRVTSAAATTPADQRTPEQVEEIRTAARTMIEGFNAVAGEDSGITVSDSDTGAVVNGLLTNPDDDTPVEVPAERVLVMTAGDTAVMMVATDVDNSPLELSDGSLQVTGDGRIAVRVAGLPQSTAGEVLMLPGRLVLGTFTTASDGTLSGTIALPTDVSAGDYAIALVVGTSRIGVGVKANPVDAVLPATGGSTPVSMAFLVLGLGLLLSAIASRRQRPEPWVPGA